MAAAFAPLSNQTGVFTHSVLRENRAGKIIDWRIGLAHTWRMSKLSRLSIQQLQRALAIRQQIESLIQELDALEGNFPIAYPGRGRRAPSVTDRRKAVLNGARLAKRKGVKRADANGAAPAVAKKKKRVVSPEHKAKMSESAKARWAKAKAEGKSSL